jgi:hypothetical protein
MRLIFPPVSENKSTHPICAICVICGLKKTFVSFVPSWFKKTWIGFSSSPVHYGDYRRTSAQTSP